MGLLSGIDDFTGWTLLQKNGPALETAYAATSSSASDIAYFKSVASTLTTPAALLSNYRALTFVCTAYGLSGQVDQTAILKQLMTQNPSSSSSLAQQLGSLNYIKFATALSNWSPPPFSTQTGINAAIAGYQEQSFESSVGQDNPALQNAQYFSQNAQGITSLTQLMSDPTLLTVVGTSLGIPATAFGNLSYDQQVALLTQRVDMSQFSTAAGVSNIITKYFAMDQVNQANAGTGASNPLLALFNGNGSSGQQGITITAQNAMPGSLNLLV